MHISYIWTKEDSRPLGRSTSAKKSWSSRQSPSRRAAVRSFLSVAHSFLWNSREPTDRRLLSRTFFSSSPHSDLMLPPPLLPSMRRNSLPLSFFSLSLFYESMCRSAAVPGAWHESSPLYIFFSCVGEGAGAADAAVRGQEQHSTRWSRASSAHLPTVMGGSYTFVMATISIILAGCYSGIADLHVVCLLASLSCLVPVPTGTAWLNG